MTRRHGHGPSGTRLPVQAQAPVLLLLLVLAMTACGTENDAAPATATPATAAPATTTAPDQPDAPATPESTGIVIRSAGYLAPLSTDEAARRADLIVIATVDAPGPSFWTTLDGNRPELTAEGRIPRLPKEQLRWGGGNHRPDMFTPWTFTVTKTLKGQAPESQRVLYNMLGVDRGP